jgi:hypothetical protein
MTVAELMKNEDKPVPAVQTDELDKMIDGIVESARNTQVASEEDYENTAWTLQFLSANKSKAEGLLNPFKEFAYEAHKRAVAHVKKYVGPFEDAIAILKGKRATYRVEQQHIAAQRQRELEAAATKQAEEDALAQAAELEQQGFSEQAKEVIEAAVNAPPPPVVVTAALPKVPGMGTRKIWKARVVNEKLIPREWLIPDMKAINGHATDRKERAAIPGVQFYFEEVDQIRKV